MWLTSRPPPCADHPTRPLTRSPARLSLSLSQLGALIEAGCIIGSHADFTSELSRQMEDMPPMLQERSSYAHWCGGVFLITEVRLLSPSPTFYRLLTHLISSVHR